MAAAAVSGSSAGGSGYHVSDRPQIAKVLKMKAARYGCVYEHVFRSYGLVDRQGQGTVACPFKVITQKIPPECNDFQALSTWIVKRWGSSPENHYFFIHCDDGSSERLYFVEDKNETFEAAFEKVLSDTRKKGAYYSIGVIGIKVKIQGNFNVDRTLLLVERERKQYKNMKWYAQYIRFFNSFHRLKFYSLISIGDMATRVEQVAVRTSREEEYIPEECENFAALATLLEKADRISAASIHFFVCRTFDQGRSILHPISDKNQLLSDALDDAVPYYDEEDPGTWRFSVGVIVDATQSELDVAFNVDPEIEIDSKTGVLNKIPREIIHYTSKSQSR